jgi:hypothetical protein
MCLNLSYNIKNRDIKTLLNKVKNPWRFLLLALICLVVGFLLHDPLEENILAGKYSASMIDNFSISNNNQNIIASSNTICEEGNFSEKLENWIIPSSYERVDEEGFYCLRRSSNFLSSNIWYKNLIPTKFDSLEIRYKLKNKNNSTDTIPSLIFSIGKDPKILRLYVPEKNNQIIGCEKIIASTTGFLLEREAVKSLNEPIGWQDDTEFKIRNIINKGNEAQFNINLSYLSAIDSKPIEDFINYDVDLPDPNPESTLSKISIGFGTFKGECIKPISYKFCY